MSSTDLLYGDVTRQILACAYQTHSILGPGLLETTYRKCLAREIESSGLQVEEEVPIAIKFRDLAIDAAYRADMVVNDCVLLELKAVDKIAPIHEAQTLTYLKHSGLKVGFLINFNVARLKFGIRRFIR